MSGKVTGEAVFDDIFPGEDTPVEDVPVEAAESDSEAVEDSEEDSPDEGVEGAEDASEAPENASDEDDDSEPADEWLVEGRFRKDEADKLAKSYRELESFHSKRQNELIEQIKLEREAAEKRAIELAKAMVEAQRPQLDPVALSQRGIQLEQAALQDPAAAYQAAVESGDESLVGRVAQRVARGLPEASIEGNPALAQQMIADYQARMFNAQQQQVMQQMQQMQAQNQQLQAASAIDAAVRRFEDAYGDADDVRPFIGEYLQQNADKLDFTNAEALYGHLETAYDTALGRAQRLARQNEPVEKQERVQQRKRQTFVQTGTPGLSNQREPKKTADQTFADELLSYAATERGSSPLG